MRLFLQLMLRSLIRSSTLIGCWYKISFIVSKINWEYFSMA